MLEKNEKKVKKFRKTKLGLLKKAIRFGEECIELSDTVVNHMDIISKVSHEKKRLQKEVNNLKASQKSPQVSERKVEKSNEDMEKPEETAEEMEVGEKIDVDMDEAKLE